MPQYIVQLSILLLTLLALPMTAQIVNIEDKRVDRSDTSGIFGYADLAFNIQNNGSKILAANGSARADYIYNKHLFISISRFGLVQVEGTDFVNNGFQHLRYNYRFHERITYEAFAQALYNEKTNLRFRGLLGTGLRFKVFKKEKQRIFFGTAYMYEYDEQTDPRLFLREHRLSNYLSFSFQPTSLLRFAATTYFQPRLDQFNDFRLSSDFALLLSITKRLRFKVDFSIVHDTEPPEGTVATIYSLENGLRWEF